MTPRILLIPGYHDSGIDMLGSHHQMWFAWLNAELEQRGFTVLTPDYPDAYLCRASEWLPFIESMVGSEPAVLIGHSTGAIAAMRFAETHSLVGSVLVGSYYTDLGEEDEKASGYFDTPWDAEAIKSNQQWILQFHSTDDPWISNDEAHLVHDALQTELHEFDDKGHFGGDRPFNEFPEVIEALLTKLPLPAPNQDA